MPINLTLADRRELAMRTLNGDARAAALDEIDDDADLQLEQPAWPRVARRPINGSRIRLP